MSNFLTPIPVHLDKIKALLPPGSTVDELKWNPKTNSVDLFWHNGNLKTKYLWAWPWSLAQLEQKQVPDGVVTPEMQVFYDAANNNGTGIITREKANQVIKALKGAIVPERNVLTDQPDQTKTKQREKLAGKLHKSKTPRSGDKSARHSTPVASPVDRSEPATVGGLSTVNDGP